MITVTAKAFHEKLQIEEEEIVLNGPPASLSGQVFLSNGEGETLFIRDLPVSAPAGYKSAVAMPEAIKFITSLLPGEQKSYRLRHQLPRSTPPGIYESVINVGGKEKKLKLIVQQNIEIDLNPLDVYFQGVKPGQKYSTQLSLTNVGNVAFAIPDIKHVTTLDADYLCRAAAIAMREKGGEGFNAMMDELTKNVYKDMAGWAIVDIDESGKVMQPGESIQLHFSITLPDNVDPKRDYQGNVRFWNNTISYSIKSHVE
jgi:hypothetical protein